MAFFDDFMKLDIRAGTITGAKFFEKARKPAYKLKVDFGEEWGAPHCLDNYSPLLRCNDHTLNLE